MFVNIPLTSLVFLLIRLACCGVESFPDEEISIVDFAPTQISIYTRSTSMRIFHWPLTSEYQEYIFRFSGFVLQFGVGKDCESGLAQIIIRRNGIPLFNERNSKLPPNVVFQKDVGVVYSGQFLIPKTLDTISRDVTITVNSSTSNYYFVALFLLPDFIDEDNVHFSKKCEYKMGLRILTTQALKNELQCSSPNLDPPANFLIRHYINLFDKKFLFNATENSINISMNNSVSFKWRILPIIDSGSTLKITLKSFATLKSPPNANHIALVGELKHLQMKNFTGFTSQLVLKNSNAGNISTWEIPFPLSGLWVLTVSLSCTGEENCTNLSQSINISVSLGKCVNDCSFRGVCWHHAANELSMAVCYCPFGWQGIDCSDGSLMPSYSNQLFHTLFLTLSNIAFLPCILLSLFRRYYIEAFLYTALCILSTFYHACDQASNVKFCILPYDALQYGDFFYAITSMWFTLLTVANLSSETEKFFQVSGILFLSVVVSYSRFSALAFAIPFVLGFLIACCGLWRNSKKLNSCTPASKNLLYFGLPALICAGFSVYLHTFIKTSKNYFVVHSFWHILLGGAMFLMLLLKTFPSDDLSFKSVNTFSTAAVTQSAILQPNKINTTAVSKHSAQTGASAEESRKLLTKTAPTIIDETDSIAKAQTFRYENDDK